MESALKKHKGLQMNYQESIYQEIYEDLIAEFYLSDPAFSPIFIENE